MSEFLRRLLEPSALTPHGFCLLWDPGLIWVHVVGDLAIAAAYLSIPVALVSFLRRRRDFEYPALGWLFAAFILSCGLSHIMMVVTLWYPFYWLEGAVKVATAIVSIVTAILLWPLIPRALALPSPGDLRAANARLAQEVTEKDMALAALAARERELSDLTAELERRVAERTESLARTNRRFEAALDASGVTVFSQDDSLRYTWMSRRVLERDPEAYLGRDDTDMLPEGDREPVMTMKRAVLADGETRRGEFRVGEQWFELTVQPVGDGSGLIGGAVDVTRRKEDERRIRFLLNEVKHRVGNLLSVAQAILRQTAANCETVEEVVDRYGQRLRALGGSHQLLVREGPRRADMREVIESQLGHHEAARFVIEGPRVRLDDAAVLHVGMALHELATNAAKYGALSVPGGMVRIAWTVEDGRCRLSWREMGGPPVRPSERRGFGREVIEWAAAQAVNGEVTLDMAHDGVRWTLDFPLPRVPAEAA